MIALLLAALVIALAIAGLTVTLIRDLTTQNLKLQAEAEQYQEDLATLMMVVESAAAEAVAEHSAPEWKDPAA